MFFFVYLTSATLRVVFIAAVFAGETEHRAPPTAANKQSNNRV